MMVWLDPNPPDPTAALRAILDAARVERVLPPTPPYALEPVLLDLTMMLELGSRERTEQEWRELLASTGFGLMRVTATDTPMSVLDARLREAAGA